MRIEFYVFVIATLLQNTKYKIQNTKYKIFIFLEYFLVNTDFCQ